MYSEGAFSNWIFESKMAEPVFWYSLRLRMMSLNMTASMLYLFLPYLLVCQCDTNADDHVCCHCSIENKKEVMNKTY